MAGLFSSIRENIRKRKREKFIKDWEAAGCPPPAPHEIKQAIIKDYQSKYNCKILVETGTFKGQMVEAQKNNFEYIYSIELADKLYADAAKLFENDKHISIVHGDSGKVLPGIMKKINQPALFWLDGHYSAGETARGETDCPIYEEIDAILSGSPYKHVLLVDDARLFNGQGDYPTIENLTAFVRNRNNAYELEVDRDIIRYVIR